MRRPHPKPQPRTPTITSGTRPVTKPMSPLPAVRRRPHCRPSMTITAGTASTPTLCHPAVHRNVLPSNVRPDATLPNAPPHPAPPASRLRPKRQTASPNVLGSPRRAGKVAQVVAAAVEAVVDVAAPSPARSPWTPLCKPLCGRVRCPIQPRIPSPRRAR
jgi:hypothetical protein